MSDEPIRRRRQRRLSEAERTLWREITHDMRPLRRGSAARQNVAEPEAGRPVLPTTEKTPRQDAAPSRDPARPPPLAPLGRRMRQRIVRGTHAIEDRLDLHGMTQREAHDALRRFLRAAQQRGLTLVLIITGKGGSTADGGERGVLKRQVPQWLRLPACRELIVGFEPAHIAHGGEGALYVRLRRQRNNS